LWLIASGKPAGPWVVSLQMVRRSQPGKYSLGSCFITEIVMTFFFLFVIIGSTSRGAAVGFAGIPIGLALTLIHLVSIRSPTPRSIRRGAPDPHCLLAVSISASSGCLWIAPITAQSSPAC
jgi:aquaporin Z